MGFRREKIIIKNRFFNIFFPQNACDISLQCEILFVILKGLMAYLHNEMEQLEFHCILTDTKRYLEVFGHFFLLLLISLKKPFNI